MTSPHTPSILNYILVICGGISAVIGSALCWAHTGSVTVDSNAQKAANYFIVGFLYIWVTAVAIIYLRLHHSRSRTGALYLLLGGLVFEVITRNQIISYAYGNMWRIYSADTSRMTFSPTTSEQDAVKSMLAGVVLGHLGILLSVIAASLTYEQHFSLKGTFSALAGWLVAIPGVVILFNCHVAELATPNSSTTVYQTTWLIIDTTLGILLVQTAGMLFDIFELVAAAVVIAGTHGAFLLGDMFMLQYQRSQFSEYDGDGRKVTAGGVLCALSVVVSFVGGIAFFNKRHVRYYTEVPLA